MKRANPKKKTAKQKAERLTKDEVNKINAGSRIVISEALYYVFSEYGWRKKRCERLLDTYNRVMEDYAKEFRERYNVGGIVAIVAGAEFHEEILKYKPDFKLQSDDLMTISVDSLCVGMMARALKELSFGPKLIARYIEGIEAILGEIANPRVKFTPNDMYDWCADVTGIDVRKVA